MLVLVKLENGNNYLFKAPKFTDIKVMDLVSVETANGEQDGVVMAILDTYYSDEKELEQFVAFIVGGVGGVGGTTPLKRVLRVAKWREVAYPTEESEEK